MKMASEKPKIKENIEGIVVGVILLVLGILTIRSYFVEEEFLKDDLPNWHESTAIITVAEYMGSDYDYNQSTYRLRFAYEFYFYNKDGERIDMTRTEEGSGRYHPTNEEMKPSHSIGDRLPISYDPENYDDYYFDTKEALRESMSKSYEIPLGFGLGIPGFVMLIYNIVRIIKKRRNPVS
jgi:hypothetical protein